MAIGIVLTTSCREIEFLKSPAPQEEADSPTIILKTVEIHITNQGMLEKKVYAKEAVYFENQQKALLDSIRMIMYDRDKELGTLTADKGTLFLAENKNARAGKNDLLLEGNIEYNGTDGTYLKTSRLYWDDTQKELRCDTDYVRRKTVEGGLMTETKGKKFRTNKSFTEWQEIGATARFISTQDTGKERK